MTDKWVQKLTKLAGEYQQESSNGKADKGKFIQKAMQMANEMTDDCVSDEETKKKQKEMIGIAESFAGKLYGFDPKEKEEAKKPSKPPKKKPGKGKPSYLIPKKESDGSNDNSNNNNGGNDNDNNDSNDNQKETTTEPQHSSSQSPSKIKSKKRPTGGKPSYLIPKKETQSPPTNDDDKDKPMEQIPTQKDAKETDEEARARKKAELQASIQKEEAEIARLEKLAKERAEARAKLEAETQSSSTIDNNTKKTNNGLATKTAASAGIAATTAAVIASNQAKKNNNDNENDGNNATTTSAHDLSQEMVSLPPTDCPSPSAPPASEDTDFYSVVVPQGVRPGTAFKVDIGGKHFEVTCPPNVKAGQQMRVELPKEQLSGRRKSIPSKSSEPNPLKDINSNSNSNSLHYVIVPQGVSPGMPFRVAVGGTQFTVTCPPNARAGQKVAVKVPVKVRGRSKSPKPPSASSSQPTTSSISSSSSQQEHYIFVPPNIHPGMAFSAQVNGQRFKVICPPNTKPGMRIRVAPPSKLVRQHSRSLTPPRTSFTTRKEFFDVIVPNGVLPGQQFKILAKGQEYYVTCPPNVTPGQRIRVPILLRNENSSNNSNNMYTRRPASLSPVRLHNNLQPYV